MTPSGLEPETFELKAHCSANWAIESIFICYFVFCPPGEYLKILVSSLHLSKKDRGKKFK
jgi:hypothetical protein